LDELITREESKELLKDANDTFQIEKLDNFGMRSLEEALPDEDNKETKADAAEDRIIDYNTVVKRLLIHNDEVPSSKLTPYFNHHAFYANLRHYQSQSKEAVVDFGRYLLYGEVVTSTNTILEKYAQTCSPVYRDLIANRNRNIKLLRHLPTGFTAAATVQVAGRGRGSNVWVSPAGALIFSTVVRHPMEKMQTAPVVFIQYLAAMAVVQGIKRYDKGYEDLPVKMKWPNDICMSRILKPLQ
jgi:biotin--protein ligase